MNSPRQPVHTAIDEFTNGYSKYSPLLQKEIISNLDSGMTPAKAVRSAWATTQGNAFLTNATMEGVIYSLEASSLLMVSDQVAFRKWYLDQHWVPGEKLSSTIWRTGTEMQSKMILEIKDSLKAADSWTKLASRVDRAIGPKADLPQHIDNLLKLSKKASGGDPKIIKAYNIALKKSQRIIDRLASNGAPTTRLKKAYQNIINVTKVGRVASIDKAVNRAVTAKARYNAERLARTEMARAYGEGFNARLFNDDDIIGWRWRLSSRHNVYDICDFHASVKLYPKNTYVDYPAHPHCTCNLSAVYSTDLEFSKTPVSDGQKWIESRTVAQQKQLLGVAGQKKFARNHSNWQNNLAGWTGFKRRANPSLPTDLFSEK